MRMFNFGFNLICVSTVYSVIFYLLHLTQVLADFRPTDPIHLSHHQNNLGTAISAGNITVCYSVTGVRILGDAPTPHRDAAFTCLP